MGMNEFREWSQQFIFLMNNGQWLALILTGIGSFIVLKITKSILYRLSKSKALKLKWPTLSETLLDKILHQPISTLTASIIWLVVIDTLNLPPAINKILMLIIKFAFAFAVIRVVYKLADSFGVYLTKLTEATQTPIDNNLINLGIKTLKAFILVFGFLLFLQNVGFNVFSLLAGLGLGGLAFALAAKDTAANLFGSVTVLIDKAYKVGDWIAVDGVEGAVEEIGLRSTQIRTLYNTVISIPNGVVANQKVENYSRRHARQVLMNLGVLYSTSPKQIEDFSAGVRDILTKNPLVCQAPLNISFNAYMDSSLNIRVQFDLNANNLADELVERNKINLAILKLAETLKVDFAFPTRTLHIASMPETQQLTRTIT